MNNISHEVAVWRQLAERLCVAHPDLVDDEQALFDTLDGCTSLVDAISALYESAEEDKARAVHAKERAREMSARAGRFEDRAESKRRVIAEAMTDAGIKKLEAPSATLSIRAVAPSVVISDESALPEWAWREKTTRSVNKGAIADILKDGGECPGASLSNGGVTLAARKD